MQTLPINKLLPHRMGSLLTIASRERAGGDTAPYITQAAFSGGSITYVVVRDGTITSGPTSLTVADVVDDTPGNATDPIWDSHDSTGYNFHTEIPASVFDEPGITRIEVLFTPASGQPWVTAWETEVYRMYHSGI